MSVDIREALDDLIEKYRLLLEETLPTEQMRREHAHPQRLDMRAINIHLAPEDVAKVEAMAETKGLSYTVLLRVWVKERRAGEWEGLA